MIVGIDRSDKTLTMAILLEDAPHGEARTRFVAIESRAEAERLAADIRHAAKVLWPDDHVAIEPGRLGEDFGRSTAANLSDYGAKRAAVRSVLKAGGPKGLTREELNGELKPLGMEWVQISNALAKLRERGEIVSENGFWRITEKKRETGHE